MLFFSSTDSVAEPGCTPPDGIAEHFRRPARASRAFIAQRRQMSTCRQRDEPAHEAHVFAMISAEAIARYRRFLRLEQSIARQCFTPYVMPPLATRESDAAQATAMPPARTA